MKISDFMYFFYRLVSGLRFFFVGMAAAGKSTLVKGMFSKHYVCNDVYVSERQRERKKTYMHTYAYIHYNDFSCQIYAYERHCSNFYESMCVYLCIYTRARVVKVHVIPFMCVYMYVCIYNLNKRGMCLFVCVSIQVFLFFALV
jgi:hypothetical protein